jgi:Domain of unknown function (DUF2427)
MTVAGYCKNCTQIAENKIDLTSTSQKFIWAVGPPGYNPWTKAQDGPLRTHDYYGYFQMDMTKAQGNGMPPLGIVTLNAQGYKGTTHDHDFGDSCHAVVMVVAFLVVFPLGVFALRVMSSVKLHMWLQTAGLILGLIGLFSGIYISTMYNRVSSIYF